MDLVPYSHGQTLLVVLRASRLDAAVAVRFKDEMRRITGDASGDVILDLSAVGFLDSSGLGALVSAGKQLGPHRQLELAGLSPMVARVFQLTRMDTVFCLHATADEGLAGRAHAS